MSEFTTLPNEVPLNTTLVEYIIEQASTFNRKKISLINLSEYQSEIKKLFRKSDCSLQGLSITFWDTDPVTIFKKTDNWGSNTIEYKCQEFIGHDILPTAEPNDLILWKYNKNYSKYGSLLNHFLNKAGDCISPTGLVGVLDVSDGIFNHMFTKMINQFPTLGNKSEFDLSNSEILTTFEYQKVLNVYSSCSLFKLPIADLHIYKDAIQDYKNPEELSGAIG